MSRLKDSKAIIYLQSRVQGYKLFDIWKVLSCVRVPWGLTFEQIRQWNSEMHLVSNIRIRIDAKAIFCIFVYLYLQIQSKCMICLIIYSKLHIVYFNIAERVLTAFQWKSLFAATPKMVIVLEMDIMRL